MNSILFKPTLKQLQDLQETDLTGKIIIVLNASLNVASKSSILLSSCGGQMILIDRVVRKEKLNDIVLKCNQLAKNGNKWQSINGKWQRSQQTISFLYENMDDISQIIQNITNDFHKIDFLFLNPECSEIVPESKIINISSLNLLSQLQSQYERDLILMVKFLQNSIKYIENCSGSIAILTTCEGHIKPQSNNLSTSLLNSSLSMFIKCLALELGPKGIRVNMINYLIEDNFEESKIQGLEVNQSMIDQFTEKLSKNNHKLINPDDISWAVLHLASNKRSQFLNGINLIVDNAKTLQ